MLVRAGTSADHALIQRLLYVCGSRSTPAEFQAQNEEPCYEPQRRLLAINRHQPVGHVRLIPRVVRFASLQLPVCELADLAVLPEWQGRGAEAALIAAAEQEARADGALFAVARQATRQFQDAGWQVGPRHTYSTIGPRKLLALYRQLPTRGPAWLEESAVPDCAVRLWRRMELGIIMRLYEATFQHTVGATVRSEAYWNWLLTRGGCDRIYVAIDGPQRLDPSETVQRIYGYMALRDARIVECAVAPERPDALAALLTRASDDALERDWHPLRFDAPPDAPLHGLLESLGGQRFHHDADDGRAIMLRMFDPADFVTAIGSELLTRAQAAEVELPLELGLLVERQRWQLRVSKRGARLTPGGLGRSYLTLSRHDLIRLLTGRSSAQDLLASGRVQSSTRLAAEAATALFPRLAWWLPVWDALEAGE